MVEMYRRSYSNIRATVNTNQNKRVRRLDLKRFLRRPTIGYLDYFEWNYIE